MVSGVALVMRWILLPVSLIVGLAAVLRMAGPAAGGADDLTGVIRLPRPVTLAILVLFALAAVVFLIGLARRMRARRRRGSGDLELAPEATPMPAWLRTLTQVLSLANFVVIAYLIWRGVIPLTELLNFGQGAIAGLGAAADQVPIGAPALVTWTFGVLAVVAALGALAFALWLGFGDRLLDWWLGKAEEPGPWSPGAEDERLEDPRGEPDPRARYHALLREIRAGRGALGCRSAALAHAEEFMRETLRHLAAPRRPCPR